VSALSRNQDPQQTFVSRDGYIVSFFTEITPQNLETLAAKRCDTIKLF
jgi:hypothetical protein